MGNLLHTRYEEVLVTDSSRCKHLKRTAGGDDLESTLISEIASRHDRYVKDDSG